MSGIYLYYFMCYYNNVDSLIIFSEIINLIKFIGEWTESLIAAKQKVVSTYSSKK